jgi:hypothetical protein
LTEAAQPSMIGSWFCQTDATVWRWRARGGRLSCPRVARWHVDGFWSAAAVAACAGRSVIGNDALEGLLGAQRVAVWTMVLELVANTLMEGGNYV